MMNLESILFTQGFGSRRQCHALISQARVAIKGEICTNPQAQFELDALIFEVDGVKWLYRKYCYVILNKPSGYECSHEPQHHLSVFNLLPPPLTARGVQCVGRLDQDTTGLLLLSDEGLFIHAYTSPKRKVPKTYLATTRHPLDDMQLATLREGVMLHGEAQPIAAALAHQRGERLLEITVNEGKYHQVKRMIAASGNRCEALHRERIGELTLPDTLAPGAWRWLSDEELKMLGYTTPP